MTDPGILDRIDDTLDDYDTWSGHSPDAARWAGGPEESEWPDEWSSEPEVPRGYDAIMSEAYQSLVQWRTRRLGDPPAFVMSHEQRNIMLADERTPPPAHPGQQVYTGPDCLLGIPVIWSGDDWTCPSNLVDLRHAGRRT